MSAEVELGTVRAAVDGDERAVAAIVRHTERSVRGVCRAHGSGDDTDDLVQETYLRALRALGTYRGDAPFGAWLHSICRRVCADEVRRRSRRRRLLDRLAVASPAPAPPETDQEAFGLLASLDPDRRAAFVLTQLLGLPYEDAAAAMGCPVGTIRSRVARARADLRHLIRDAEAA